MLGTTIICCVWCRWLFLFFFKQKTAYEMRIRDWSSDVCSSDLTCPLPLLEHWQAPVLALLRDREMLKALPMALGPLQGFRLGLDVPVLTDALGDLIRPAVLTAYRSQPSAAPALPLEAAS